MRTELKTAVVAVAVLALVCCLIVPAEESEAVDGTEITLTSDNLSSYVTEVTTSSGTVTGLNLSEGDYVLGSDISPEYKLIIQGNTTIDLSTYTINGKQISIPSGATLTLESGVGGTVEGSSSQAIDVTGTLNMTGGTVVADGSMAIRVNLKGTANVSGGIINSGSTYGFYNMGTSTITGGQINSEGNEYTVYVNKGTITIDPADGTSMDIPYIYVKSTAICNIESNVSIARVGGTFGDDCDLKCSFTSNPTGHIPGKLVAVYNESTQTWNPEAVDEDNAIAKLEGSDETSYYGSLKAAVEAASNGDKVTLLKDYISDAEVKVSVFELTIDLNGNDVTNTSTGSAEHAIIINASKGYEANGQKVVLTSSNGPSTISASIPISLGSSSSLNRAMLSIEGDGITLNDTGSAGKIELSSGALLVYSESMVSYLSNGAFRTSVDGVECLYDSLGNAIKDSDDGNISLTGNYRGPMGITSTGGLASYVLDLGGFTATSNASSSVSISTAIDLTIKNGKLINECTTSGDYNESGIDLGTNPNETDDITLKLIGVEVEADGYWGIVTNGNNTGIELTLDNSSVKSQGHGIYFPATGSLTIIDSDVTGSVTGVEIRRGTIEVSGDSTIAGGTVFDITEEDASGGTAVKGAGIAVVPYSSTTPITLKISGGSISGAYGLYEDDVINAGLGDTTFSITGGTFYGSTAPVVVDEETPGEPVLKSFITGGSFRQGTPTESTAYTGLDADYLPEGYAVSSEGDDAGSVSLTDPSDIAAELDNGAQFTSFEDALAAATEGQTILIHKQVTVTDEMTVGAVTVKRGENYTGYMFSVQGGTLALNGTTVDGGGVVLQNAYGISVTNNGKLTTNGAVIQNCKGDVAIYVSDSEATLTDTEIKDNSTLYDTVWAISSTFVMDGCTVSNNINRESSDYGVLTSVTVQGGTANITGTTFSNNESYAALRFLSNNDINITTATVMNCTFTDNTAIGIDVAIRTGTAPNVTLTGITASGNTGDAVSIYAYQDLDVKLSGSNNISGIVWANNYEDNSGSSLTLASDFSNSGELDIYMNHEAEEPFANLTIEQGADTSNVSFFLGSGEYIVGPDGSLVQPVSVVFKTPDNKETYLRVSLAPGTLIDLSEYDLSAAEKEGYTLSWHRYNVEEDWDFDTDTVPTDATTITLLARYTLAAPTVTLTASSTSATEGETITLTATAEPIVSGMTYTYTWMRDGTPFSTGTDSTTGVKEGGSYIVTVTVTDAEGQTATSEPSDAVTLQFTAPTTHTVTFLSEGKTVDTKTVTHGGFIDLDTVNQPEREGYIFFGWDQDLMNITSDMTVNALWALVVDLGVDVSGTLYEGGSITVSVSFGYTPSAGESVYYQMIVDGEETQPLVSNEFVIDAPGTYEFVAYALSGSLDDPTVVAVGYSDIMKVEYGSGPDVQPSPGYDDEDLPPFIPAQPSGSGDGDSVTIVACAAAAVVAALMAVFLIVSYRKD